MDTDSALVADVVAGASGAGAVLVAVAGAVRGVGAVRRLPTCPVPTTPQPGSPGGYRTAGSPVRRRSAWTEGGDTAAAQSAAKAGRISRFREQTRETRIEIAQQAEHRYGRKVAWGARLGGSTELFTTVAVPVMTRLRQPERQVLDTLVDSGVARSRSEALAWAVRLVGEHAEEWLGELREAMKAVEEVRGKGPELS